MGHGGGGGGGGGGPGGSRDCQVIRTPAELESSRYCMHQRSHVSGQDPRS